jgi:hypothetical protein
MTSRIDRFSRSTRARTDDIPASPPPEVLDAIADAAAAYDRLEASGRRMHFDLDAATRRLTLELIDADGNRLRRLTGAQVLELADGKPLP